MKNMNNIETRQVGLKERLALWVGDLLCKMAVDKNICWNFPIFEPETPQEILEEIVQV